MSLSLNSCAKKSLSCRPLSSSEVLLVMSSADPKNEAGDPSFPVNWSRRYS